MKTKKTNLRYFSVALALALCLTSVFGLTASAAETTEVNENNMFTQVSREEAAEILNVSVDELDGEEFYVLNDTATTASHVTIDAGKYHFFPTFTFSGTNMGSYWTCNGTRIQVNVTNRNEDNPYAVIGLCLYPYGEEKLPQNSLFGLVHVNVGESYSSSWLSATKGLDYQLAYYYGDNSQVSVVIGVK